MRKLIIFPLICLLIINLPLLSCTKEPDRVEAYIPETNSSANDLKETDKVRMLPAEEVRVISYNLDANTDTIERRAKLLIPHILSYEPDSIGTQEVLYTWGSVLENAIGDKYGRVGITDEGDVEKASASAVYIYYNKEKFDVVASGTVWLTETPTQPAGRTCTWGVFENKKTGFRYAHVNTHLEWVDDEENKYQMTIIRDLCDQLHTLGYPVFTTGDFNTSEGSDSYQIMTSTDFMDDSKFLAEKSMDLATMHRGDPNPTGRKPIDFCFVTGGLMQVHEYEVINSVLEDGTFMSDHNGIFVRSTVSSMPDQLQFAPEISTDGIEVTVHDVRPYVAEISFTQALDTSMIDSYRVSAMDASGNEVCVRTILSRYLHPTPPETLYCTLTGLDAGTEYTVMISPTSLTGTYSSPVTVVIKTPNAE